MIVRTCAWQPCGKQFVAVNLQQKYCSGGQCQRQQNNADAKAKRAAANKLAPRICIGCGEEYKPHQGSQKRCTLKCGVTRTMNLAYQTTERLNAKLGKELPSWKEARDQKKASGVKIPKGVRPDADGNWFPGWDGYYPPSFTPYERELLERGRVA